MRAGLPFAIATFLSTFAAESSGGAPAETLEESVCGWLREPLAFALWSSAAGSPRAEITRELGEARAEPITHETRDGRLLRGYRLSARPGRSVQAEPKGFVLVAQGNAMLADQLLFDLAPLAAHGDDVYIYDYRGYGRSEGKRRLKAIVADYQDIVAALHARTGTPARLYGISFGGIVLMNAIGAGAAYVRAVIDSSPSRVSPFGCPERYDPLNNVPADASRLLIVRGEHDGVVKPGDSQELAETAQVRGAKTVLSSQFAHPFMDSDPAVQEARKTLIQSFLFDSAAR
ncbi:MAG: alpha/beta hydrolase [Burkholderiales bacterium]